VLERVLGRLREEFTATGKARQFDRVKVFLIGESSSLRYSQIAAELGTTQGALKVAVHRLRRRYGALLREEIAQTVDAPDQVSEPAISISDTVTAFAPRPREPSGVSLASTYIAPLERKPVTVTWYRLLLRVYRQREESDLAARQRRVL